MAERKRFGVTGINVELVRKLLDEHRAPFPKFYALLPEDERWLRSRSGVNPDGQCNHYGNGDCAIFLHDAGYKTADRACSVVIHELRHWWQHNATTEAKKLAKFCLVRLLVECAVVAAILITILGLLAIGWTSAVLVVSLLSFWAIMVFFVFRGMLGTVLCRWCWRLPLRTTWLEYDAERFTKDNQGRPKWKEAIVIQEIDQK